MTTVRAPYLADAARVDVSVVVVSFNTAALLRPMFAALEAARANLTMQVIVVDNASTDGSVELLRQAYPHVQLIANATNVGFGRANNQALPLLRGRYVLLLNTDAFVAPGALCTAVEHMERHPFVGIVGARLTGPDGAEQPSARWFPNLISDFALRTGLSRLLLQQWQRADLCPAHGVVVDCDWVPGCFYLIRRAVIEQVGLFDPRFFLYFEEVEHCRQVRRAGWEIACHGGVEVVHIGGESARSVAGVTAAGQQISPLQIESEMLYFRKELGIFGAMACVALGTIADVVIALKGVARGRTGAAWRAPLSHCKTTWALALRTALGARPTR